MSYPHITRVVIENYKSIRRCDVALGPLQFLVGRNGSGKSNFLDAIAFVRDALWSGLFQTTIKRQGPELIMHRLSKREPTSMRLEFDLGDGMEGIFAFELNGWDGDSPAGYFSVERELCIVKKNGHELDKYETKGGRLPGQVSSRYSPVAEDRLYLSLMMTSKEFRPLSDVIYDIEIYNPVPEKIANWAQEQDDRRSSDTLSQYGTNLASILGTMDKDTLQRITEYLQTVNPSIESIEPYVIHVNPRNSRKKLWAFNTGFKGFALPETNISDGTLRALAILTALFQKDDSNSNGHNFPTVIGIEEPETSLHTHATSSLLAAMEEASEMRQVLVTTHSTDMLDDEDIPPETILPVVMENEETIIGSMEQVSKDILKKHLTTVGELLRQDHLAPANEATERRGGIFD